MQPITDDVLGEYLSECQEMLDRVGLLLGRLEKGGLDLEVLRSVARDMHTIKGSSQLFGYRLIGQVAHAVEECLERLRDGASGGIPGLVDALYGALDLISQLFQGVKATKAEPALASEVKGLVSRLEALAKESPAPGGEPSAGASTPAATSTPPVLPSGESPASTTMTGTAARPVAEDTQNDTIRVHVGLLDNLMNLVGELVLVRNQLQQATRLSESEDVIKVSQRLNVITGELQNDLMKTRMQPIGNVLSKFQRVVRDLAKELGKQIELVLSGTETELDKTLIEAVRDPLMHLVRNAIDHGLETPDERQSAGKPVMGRLEIRSFHESGQVVIEIVDDGRGLSRDRIGAKAVERGLVTAEALARLTDRDVHQFIFLPGFSTAAKVSDLSGRGVGMDVVKTNLERIGGTVDLTSKAGRGSTVTLKIPLTLAIIPALIVRIGTERYAIPQVKLVELLRIPVQGDGGVEHLQGRPVFNLRGSLLPLVELREVLGIEAPGGRDDAEVVNVAVLSADRQTFGLIVDTIEDSADIVVKPLALFLKDLGAYSGATIMGDGAVTLTLDVAGIAELAHIRRDGVEQNASGPAASTQQGGASDPKDEVIEYLMVDIGAPGKFAIPLCVVSRLEEFAAADVKLSGEQKVVRYRQGLLPLLNVGQALGFASKEGGSGADGRVPVVVVKHGERHFGLQVRAIVDVVLSHARIDSSIRDRDGLLGTLIDGEDVIVLIDALHLIARERHGPQAVAALTPEPTRPSGELRRARGRHRVLLAEDGAFFRKQVVQILEESGYSVAATVDGQQALVMLEKSPAGTFSILVSDIDMPNMTGLELARQVRVRKVAGSLPLIALSSRYSHDAVRTGMEAGFDRYLEKLNPEQLIDEVDAALGLKEGIRHVGS